jgi:DNA-binding FrmR family transcriptional regulator
MFDIYPYGVYYNCIRDTPQGYANRIFCDRRPIMSEKDKCCCHRKKVRDDKEYRDLMNRLKRIEGQVRGIQRMLEENAYCPEIMVQVSAVNNALNSFNKVLLAEHIRTCVVDDIKAGREETIDELTDTLKKVMK